jgi:hypothetical protein
MIMSVVGKQGMSVPPAEMIIVIHNHLIDYYPTITLEEFGLAFEFNIVGKYEHKVEHYQSFDLNFISTVLERYLEYKRSPYVFQPITRLFENAMYIQSERQLAEHKPETEPLDIDALLKEDLDEARKGKFVISQIRAPFVMQILLEQGRFKDDMFPDEKWKEWWKRARVIVKESEGITRSKWKLIVESPDKLRDYKFRCSQEVKRFVYRAYLIKMLEVEQIKIDSDYRERLPKPDFNNGLIF